MRLSLLLCLLVVVAYCTAIVLDERTSKTVKPGGTPRKGTKTTMIPTRTTKKGGCTSDPRKKPRSTKSPILGEEKPATQDETDEYARIKRRARKEKKPVEDENAECAVKDGKKTTCKLTRKPEKATAATELPTLRKATELEFSELPCKGKGEKTANGDDEYARIKKRDTRPVPTKTPPPPNMRPKREGRSVPTIKPTTTERRTTTVELSGTTTKRPPPPNTRPKRATPPPKPLNDGGDVSIVTMRMSKARRDVENQTKAPKTDETDEYERIKRAVKPINDKKNETKAMRPKRAITTKKTPTKVPTTTSKGESDEYGRSKRSVMKTQLPWRESREERSVPEEGKHHGIPPNILDGSVPEEGKHHGIPPNILDGSALEEGKHHGIPPNIFDGSALEEGKHHGIPPYEIEYVPADNKLTAPPIIRSKRETKKQTPPWTWTSADCCKKKRHVTRGPEVTRGEA